MTSAKNRWKKIELCTNDRELGDVLRKIKGQGPRKSAKVIRLERDGSIYLWKNDVKKFVGFLNIKEAKDDPDIRRGD